MNGKLFTKALVLVLLILFPLQLLLISSLLEYFTILLQVCSVLDEDYVPLLEQAQEFLVDFLILFLEVRHLILQFLALEMLLDLEVRDLQGPEFELVLLRQHLAIVGHPI